MRGVLKRSLTVLLFISGIAWALLALRTALVYLVLGNATKADEIAFVVVVVPVCANILDFVMTGNNIVRKAAEWLRT